VVNSGDETRTVPLGGRYRSGVDAVDRIELAPRSGAVLTTADP